VETNRTGGIKMAFITDILNTIKNARKGKDMRQAIYDGIQQCYKDATGHPDSVAAVVERLKIEKGRIDELATSQTFTGNYTQSNLVFHAYRNATAGDPDPDDSYNYEGTSGKHEMPICKIFQEGTLDFAEKQSNEKVKILKEGLYIFELRIFISGSGKLDIEARINDVSQRYNAWQIVAQSTEETKIIAYILYLKGDDVVSFYGTPGLQASVRAPVSDVNCYVLDWIGKAQISDCSKEISDIRVGEDGAVYGTAGEAVRKQIGNITEDLDYKIEHVDGYKEYDIGAPSVGTYWNKSAKKQLESETYQSFNPISLKAGTYHYENMSGSFTFYEDTDGNWIPIGKYTASGNGDVEIPNDTTMYITEMQKSGVFAGAKLSSGDITQKESNWFKKPKYDIDNINNTLESLSDSVNDIKSIDGSAIKEYCIYVSTTGSDTSGDGSEEKPFATIYHANETITDNSYTKRYRIIVLPGTYTDLQDKYTGITPTGKYQGVITKPWVTYESKSGNPKDTIIEWDGSTGLENPTRDDVVEKCAFHIVSLPRTFTAIKGFTIKSKNTRYAMHCESSSRGIQGEWLIENCIFDWGGCPDISDDTGKFPAIGIGMSPCEKGTIKFCKIVTTTVETMLVHDGKNNNGNSAVILGAELNFIKCDLGTGRLQFQSIYPKSGEINAKTNNICNLVSCTQINSLYSYISSLNSDGEMVWRVYEKDCDFASYGNMSDYVYKIGTANNVSN
jgi:hypothetical protein